MEFGSRESPLPPDASSQVGSPSAESEHTQDLDPYEVLEKHLAEELAPDLKILRLLGRGAVASVYLAQEPGLKRLVAVKVLSPMLGWNNNARLRFEREAQSAARIFHPNVVPVHRVGTLSDGVPYLTMAFIEGRSLAQRLKAEGLLEVGEVRQILTQLAAALQAAHEEGIVHRHVKPSNVLCEEKTGRVLLTDFGIAAALDTADEAGPRLTPIGQLVGDLRHMSPEQLAGKELTGEADVYGLAILGYELLTGEGPYGQRTISEMTTAHLQEEPTPLAAIRDDVDAELAEVLLRCLEKTPGDRPRASDVVRLLSRTGAARLRPTGDSSMTGGAGVGVSAAAVPSVSSEADATKEVGALRTKTVSMRPPEEAFELRILGTLELRASDGRSLLSVLAQPKRVALLSYLASGAGKRFRRRDTILGVFWPDLDQERARHALRQTIYVLRRALGPGVIVSRGDQELGVSREELWCDAATFEEALATGHPEEALELYNGELLPGLYLDDSSNFERWLDTERDRLRRLAFEAAWRVVEELEAAGDTTGAAYWAHRAGGLSPYDEGALCRLVALLDKLGNRAAALSAYERFAERLRADFDADPSVETRALITSIRERS